MRFFQAGHPVGSLEPYRPVVDQGDRDIRSLIPFQGILKVQRMGDMVVEALERDGEAVGHVLVVDDDKYTLRNV